RVPSSFLDTNPNGLRYRSLSSGVQGRLMFAVRGGSVQLTTSCPTTRGLVGSAYNASLTAGGGTSPYIWVTQLVSGALPPGLSLNSAGVLSGTPTTAGSYAFSARVNDAAQRTAVAQCTLPVDGCSVTLSANQTVGAGQSTGTFTVSSASTCAWTATSNAAWIQLLNGSTPVSSVQGTGTQTLTFRVESNGSTQARTGTITVGDKTYTITQAAGTGCTLTLTPPSNILTANGGSGSFAVTSNCAAWTATENLDWLQVTLGSSGSNNGTVNYFANAYTGATQARSGIISVNGVPFTLTQNPPNATCTYNLSTATINIPAAGGTGSTFVQTSSACGWSAASNAAFVTITAGANGSVSGLVTFNVAPNSGAARTGTLAIAGQTFTVNQAAGTSCPITFTPGSATFLSSGGVGATTQVNTPCDWTATSSVPWIRITAGAAGIGPGTITYTVDPNTAPGATVRAGSITARGVTFAVTQGIPACTYSLSSSNLILPPSGGTASVTVTAPSSCSWNVTGAPSFLTTAVGQGTGRGTATFTAAANSGTGERTGTVTVAGRVLNVKQPSASAFACTAAGPSPVPNIRQFLMAELTGDLTLACGGTAPRALSGDVLVTLNTNLTSKVIGNNVDALLILSNSGSLVLNQNAFLGKLAGNNAVRFVGVPLALSGSNANRNFRITNLRADASPADIPADITARVEIEVPGVTVPVNNPQAIVARRQAPVNATFGTAINSGGVTILPVNYTELLPDTFKVRIASNQDPSTPGTLYNTESGFVNTAALGGEVGTADTGFRLQVTLRNLPATVTAIQAPVVVTNQNGTRAELATNDRTGNGVGLQAGTNALLPITNGEATATYEITAAPQTTRTETLTFNLQLTGISADAVEALKSGFLPSCGPIATGLPANGVLPVPRCIDPLAPAVGRRNVLLRGAVTAVAGSSVSTNAALRAPTGNRSVELQVTMGCDSAEACPEPVIRGNLSAGASFNGSCDVADGSGSCSGADRDVAITYPDMEPGQTVTATIGTTLLDDAPGGSLLQFNASGSTGVSVTYDVVETCIPGFSQFPEPGPNGLTDTIMVYACGPWTISNTASWITFSQTSGTGNTLVTYTVQPNTSGAARFGSVSVPGAAAINVRQLSSAAGGGLRFVPVTPCRVADTRVGSGKSGAFGPPIVVANTTRELPIPSSGCGVPATALAYSLNITVVPPGPLAFLTAWPTGQTRPVASTLNSFDGKIVANAAVVPAGTNGSVSFFVTNNTEIIVDINGYFVP
ncbi:MAG: BACON domain-containing protein, partial [Bryobacterales bacterium]|nr:BACON domain-containing protein [Bryobacterales bacterium]